MTAKVRFSPNAGFKRTLLNSTEVMGVVNEAAAGIHRRAIGMFDASNYVMKPARPGKTRCHAIVATGDRHAVNSNALHMTLQKSVKG